MCVQVYICGVCVCWCVHHGMCAQWVVRMCACACTGIHLDVVCTCRSQNVVSHRLPTLIFFLNNVSFLELELTNLARLAGQGAPEVLLTPSFQRWGYKRSLFYVSAGDQA